MLLAIFVEIRCGPGPVSAYVPTFSEKSRAGTFLLMLVPWYLLCSLGAGRYPANPFACGGAVCRAVRLGLGGKGHLPLPVLLVQGRVGTRPSATALCRRVCALRSDRYFDLFGAARRQYFVTLVAGEASILYGTPYALPYLDG